MGHARNTRDFNVKQYNKDYIQAICSEEAEDEGDCHSPLSAIKFEDKVFETRADAMRYLDERSRNESYYQGAVKYKKYIEQEENKKSERHKKLAKEAATKGKEKAAALQKYVYEHAKRNAKSLFFTCPNCNSKVNKNYIKLVKISMYARIDKLKKEQMPWLIDSWNSFNDLESYYSEPCPVCNFNMMSESTQQYQESLWANHIAKAFVDLNTHIHEAELAKQDKKKFDEVWLVRYEYHV